MPLFPATFGVAIVVPLDVTQKFRRFSPSRHRISIYPHSVFLRVRLVSAYSRGESRGVPGETRNRREKERDR